MKSTWNETALDLVGDLFLVKPLHPQWMRLDSRHRSQAQILGLSVLETCITYALGSTLSINTFTASRKVLPVDFKKAYNHWSS